MSVAWQIRRRPVSGTASGILPSSLHPVLRRVYAARGLGDPRDLDLSLQHLLRAETLGGLDAAVALLERALREGRRIVFVADFDADGATSCALGLRVLRALGAAHVDYVVPNRFEYGYGLTPPIVELARSRGAEILVTVDNGISSLEGVAAARAAGLSVLITDHHLPGASLPAADAIVNPNLPGDEFPSKALAGVGVIFYVMLGLRAALRAHGWFAERSITEPNLAELLDLVALGTVADVVPLDANNRRLVAQGLARLRAGRGQPGIRALVRIGGRDPERLSAADLGFAVAPRLNAAGRLADMSLGIELLLADDPQRCAAIAAELDELNRSRRELERDTRQAALDQVVQTLAPADGVPAGLCVFDDAWHQGIIGIVAGRVKERYHRPVIAFAPGQGAELKGSARSIAGIHIRDVLDTVAARHPGLLTRFGGHAMAAGLSLPREHLARFEAAFIATLEEVTAPELLEACLWTDGELTPDDMSLDLAQRIADAGPWGQAFPEPLFDGIFELREKRIMAEAHLRLSLVYGQRVLSAVAFNAAEAAWPVVGAQVRLAYRLNVNHWAGEARLQLVIEHGEAAA